MLIGYGQPSNVTWTLSGAGTAWLGDGTPAALTDGKPARVARFRWLSSTPALTDNVVLAGHWSTATPIRLIGLLGLKNVPTGLKVEIRGQRVGDATPSFVLGGNALTQTVARDPNGSYSLWIVADSANPPLMGVEVRFFNNVGGTTIFTAVSTIDIGEVAIMSAVEIDHERGWSMEVVDPSINAITLGGQLNTVKRVAYRRLNCRFTPQALTAVRANGLANGMDLQQLESALRGSSRCCAIPRWKGAGGMIDSAELHRTALYGFAASISGTEHMAGPWYQQGYAFQEIPAAG